MVIEGFILEAARFWTIWDPLPPGTCVCWGSPCHLLWDREWSILLASGLWGGSQQPILTSSCVFFPNVVFGQFRLYCWGAASQEVENRTLIWGVHFQPKAKKRIVSTLARNWPQLSVLDWACLEPARSAQAYAGIPAACNIKTSGSCLVPQAWKGESQVPDPLGESRYISCPWMGIHCCGTQGSLPKTML